MRRDQSHFPRASGGSASRERSVAAPGEWVARTRAVSAGRHGRAAGSHPRPQGGRAIRRGKLRGVELRAEVAAREADPEDRRHRQGALIPDAFLPGHELIFWEGGEPICGYLDGHEIDYRRESGAISEIY